MGLKERLKKFDKDKFRPQILDESTVQTYFNNCLATAETTREDTFIYSLFTQKNGFDSDTKPISYSKSNIAKHKKSIRYLLGQVENTHTRELNIKITDLAKLYTGKQWTDNSGILTEFAILCAISGSVYSFEREGNDACSIIQQIVKPALSPEDPNFESWWEEHKSEWED